MTQRDLTDKLNVSDKTVSRWERDINAPDLSLLPIIADLFDVTCDELLRGERVTEQRREEDSRRTQERAQEQWQRLCCCSATAPTCARSTPWRWRC